MSNFSFSFTTERLFVRPIEPSDKDQYMDLRMETSDVAVAYRVFPDCRDKVWEGELNSGNDMFLIVFLKDSGIFVAIAALQDLSSESIDLGFDVVSEYRSQGIATELVKGMIDAVRTAFPGKGITIRTNADNVSCRRVAEKCGGVLTGHEPTQAATLVSSLLSIIEEHGLEDPETWHQQKQKDFEFVENNKEGLCVYTL